MTLYDIPKSFFWQKLFLWPLLSIAFFIIMLIVSAAKRISVKAEDEDEKAFFEM